MSSVPLTVLNQIKTRPSWHRVQCFSYRAQSDQDTSILVPCPVFLLPCSTRSRHVHLGTVSSVSLTVFYQIKTRSFGSVSSVSLTLLYQIKTRPSWHRVQCFSYRVPSDQDTSNLAPCPVFLLPCSIRSRHVHLSTVSNVFLTLLYQIKTRPTWHRVQSFSYLALSEQDTSILVPCPMFLLPCFNKSRHVHLGTVSSLSLTLLYQNKTRPSWYRVQCFSYLALSDQDRSILVPYPVFLFPCSIR